MPSWPPRNARAAARAPQRGRGGRLGSAQAAKAAASNCTFTRLFCWLAVCAVIGCGVTTWRLGVLNDLHSGEGEGQLSLQHWRLPLGEDFGGNTSHAERPLATGTSGDSSGHWRANITKLAAAGSFSSETGQRTKLPLLSGSPSRIIMPAPTTLFRNVHAFYYMWYGNPQVDGTWIHWDHEYLPHWTKQVAEKYPEGKHNPDLDDAGSTFWPALGLYSSRDREVIKTHLRKMRQASIGVAVISWYPPGMKDEHGVHEHAELVDALLEEAGHEGLEVAIHIEPYKDRTAASVRRDLEFIHKRYGKHPSLHRRLASPRHRTWLSEAKKNVSLPLIYVYDSYHTTPSEWASLLEPDGSISIRGTVFDAVVLCLWVERSHEDYLAHGGFDGAYTYFATSGFTFGSTVERWPDMAQAARRYGAFFVPSAGPGYNDLKVRPWNEANVRKRENGKYFRWMLDMAAQAASDIVSLTSWNEWHEGTNLEPAVPKLGYEDYGAAGSEAYLDIVKEWAHILASKRTTKNETSKYWVAWHVSDGLVEGHAFDDLPSASAMFNSKDGGESAAMLMDVNFQTVKYYGNHETGVLSDFEAWWRQQFHPVSKAKNEGPVKVVSGVVVLPVLIICHARPQYLRRALASVFKHRQNAEAFPISASQDGGPLESAAKQRGPLAEVQKILQEHVAGGELQHYFNHPAGSGSGYERLAQHYGWALRQMFEVLGYEHLVILEEDLEVSIDFFGYFSGMLPLLQADPRLFCVSAWNDNGGPDIAYDSEAVFRSEFFPGLGWMLLRTFYNEIRARWPRIYWDEFMRRDDVRKGRHCLRPEVSRTHTFGEQGVSNGQFYHQHLAGMVLNQVSIDWLKKDLHYLSTPARFDAYFEAKIRPLPVVGMQEVDGYLRSGQAVVVRYKDLEWGTYAQRFGLMADEKSGIRRGSYRGVLAFTWKHKLHVYLVRDWPLE